MIKLKKLIKNVSDERWNIGFIQNDMASILSGEELCVKWLKHDSKYSWFADPFILDVTDNEIHVLVEEYYKPIQRGRISRLIIDRYSYEIKQKDVVLELRTHLSFPAIIRKEKDVFIYPENGESGELNLYQYFPESNKCVKIETILSEAVADAILARVNGEDRLFCTKKTNPNGNELYVFTQDESGRYLEKERYTFDENVARMAGDFFEYKGKIYRPTQECNVQYGHAVTLQEVLTDGNELCFKEVRRLYSVHPKLNVGMHTFNMYKGIIVTDALGFDNMWIRKCLKAFGIM